MKYFQVLALEVFTLNTNIPVDMNELLPWGKTYHCHSFQGYSDITMYYLEASQYLNGQHFNGWMQGTILLKNKH